MTPKQEEQDASNLRFTITEQEIVNNKHPNDVILGILKDKGAPIVGNFILEVEYGYEIISIQKPNGDLVYIFKKELK